MLQKVTALLLFSVISLQVLSQDYSAAKTRKLLTTHEWELKYILVKDKRQEISPSLKGLRMVFMPGKDLMYEYFPSGSDVISIRSGKIDEQHFKYEDRVEEPEQIIDMEKLKEGVLSFTSEFDSENRYYVYEKADAIKGKGYPSRKYEVQDVDVPMQRLSPKVSELTNSITAELKKSAGHLFFYDKNKTRYLIKDVSFQATEYGVKFTMVYDTKDSKNRHYSYEFLPERIDEITDVKVDPDSRVGQIKLTLDNEACFYNSIGSPQTIIKTVYIDYYKESVNSFANIKKKFEDLSDAYLYGREHRLQFLEQYINKGREIFLSLDGASRTYKILDLDFIGSKMYLYYNLETVDLSSTRKGSYLTVVPLKDINALSVEITKSNPKTLIMHAKKKGFETFNYSSGKYVAGSAVQLVPLFNYGELGWNQQRIDRTLPTLIDDDGGGKVKVVYNP